MPALNPANALPFGARILINLQKAETQKNLSFRRKPESSYFTAFWTPAFAGETTQKTFYEIINVSGTGFFRDAARKKWPLRGS